MEGISRIGEGNSDIKPCSEMGPAAAITHFYNNMSTQNNDNATLCDPASTRRSSEAVGPMSEKYATDPKCDNQCDPKCDSQCDPVETRRSPIGLGSVKWATEDWAGAGDQALATVYAAGTKNILMKDPPRLIQQKFHPGMFLHKSKSVSMEEFPNKPNNSSTDMEIEHPTLKDGNTQQDSLTKINQPDWQKVPNMISTKTAGTPNYNTTPKGQEETCNWQSKPVLRQHRKQYKRKRHYTPPPNEEPKIVTQNRFQILSDDDKGDDLASNSEKKHKTEPKPPPLILCGIQDLRKLTEVIDTILKRSEYTFKIINKQQMRINCISTEAYKKDLVRQKKLIGHTFTHKDNKPYRIVIKNLHPTTPLQEITQEIERTGNKVKGEIINARYGPDKIPLSTFFVNLERSINNKDVKNIRYIYQQSVIIEDPKKKTSIVQCKRCQQYGHSKNNCMRPYRCVKCAEDHKTAECPRNGRYTPAKCALCLGEHPANYKGCKVYQEIHTRKITRNKQLAKARPQILPPTYPILKTVKENPMGIRKYFNTQQNRSSDHKPREASKEGTEQRKTYAESLNENDQLSNFMKSRKLTSLGMPTYHGGGSHTYKGDNYRYLVLERYGKDIWSLFKDNKCSFPLTTVFQLGLQMLDVLEYIHSRGYVHADVKGANILLGYKKGTENQAYLLDFGLAKKVSEGEFKPDPKCAHNGTIEYTSRDAHLGTATLRGDLEILGYNMLQWIIGELPWEKSLQDPKKVQQLKEDFMSDVRKNISKNYSSVPGALIEFFEHVNKLKPKETPNYTKCRSLFEAYLKSQGSTRSAKLDFKATKKPKATKASKSTTKVAENDEYSDTENVEKITAKKPKKTAKTQKRKSTDSLLITKAKKTKLNPRVYATPPAKKDHTNMATQTSVDKLRKSPRSVTFDSPVSDVVADIRNGRNLKVNYSESTISSPDVFEDSFERKPNKRKKGLVVDEKLTVTKKVVKKTIKAGRSWRDAPTIMNGKRPPT